MKSPMVNNLNIPNKGGYSDLQVLWSPAGYYVGTMYTDPEDGFTEPGSRDTGYFRTEAEAAEYLRRLEGGEDLEVREHP